MSIAKEVLSIQSLKKIAKQKAVAESVSLSYAQDEVAREQGFTHWALMLNYYNSYRANNIQSIWQTFTSGEMLLLSAAQGVGKMSMALNLAAQEIHQGGIVQYLSITTSIQLIIERLQKIIGLDFAEDKLVQHSFLLKKLNANSNKVIDELANGKKASLVILDWLQAVEINRKDNCYNEFLKKLKSIVKQKRNKILILSQVNQLDANDSLNFIEGGSSIGRHFSHVIHLERQVVAEKEKRDLAVLKSIHYQKQKSILEFNKDNYRFA